MLRLCWPFLGHVQGGLEKQKVWGKWGEGAGVNKAVVCADRLTIKQARALGVCDAIWQGRVLTLRAWPPGLGKPGEATGVMTLTALGLRHNARDLASQTER